MNANATTPAAVVTGGVNGIGRGIARHLAERGWRVLALDIDVDAGAGLARDGIEVRRCDVGAEADVAAAAREVGERLGGLDALVNNAGIADPDSDPIEALALADWERILRTNLTGGFLCAKHFAPMLRRRRGAVVNIASTRALQSEPDSEAYAAAKGGLLAFTHALAVSLGPDIRVNAVSPGWIDTRDESAIAAAPLRDLDHRQHPAGRVGRPADVAATVAWLLSAEAGFVTGQNIVCDGGMSRRMIYAE